MRKKVFLAALISIVVLLWIAVMQPEEKFEKTFSEIEEAMRFAFLVEQDQHKAQKPKVRAYRPDQNKVNDIETIKKAEAGYFDEQIMLAFSELKVPGRSPDLNLRSALKWYLMAVQNSKLKMQNGQNVYLRKLELVLFEKIAQENGLSPIPILVRDKDGQVKGYKHKLEDHVESLLFRAGSHYSLHARAMHSYLFTQRYNLGNKDKVAREYAVKWLHNIAEMGSRGHQLRLAALYKQGLFVQKDLDKAELWQARAIANKSPSFFDAGVDVIDRYAK